MTDIAFQVIKKAKPDINGNFESLILVYNEKGSVSRALLAGDSSPNTSSVRHLPELPVISVTNGDFREMKKDLKAKTSYV